jgi:hypothetical protein
MKVISALSEFLTREAKSYARNTGCQLPHLHPATKEMAPDVARYVSTRLHYYGDSCPGAPESWAIEAANPQPLS